MGKQIHVFEVSDFEAGRCVIPADVIYGVMKAGRCLLAIGAQKFALLEVLIR